MGLIDKVNIFSFLVCSEDDKNCFSRKVLKFEGILVFTSSCHVLEMDSQIDGRRERLSFGKKLKSFPVFF